MSCVEMRRDVGGGGYLFSCRGERNKEK